MAKKILNIFISQPMHGRDEKDILEERELIMHYLNTINPYKKTWELKLVDNLHHEARTWDYLPPERAARLYNLGQSVSQMADADLVIFAKGWSDAAGCAIEKVIATSYGILAFNVWDLGVEAIADGYLRAAMANKNKWRYKKNGKETED